MLGFRIGWGPGLGGACESLEDSCCGDAYSGSGYVCGDSAGNFHSHFVYRIHNAGYGRWVESTHPHLLPRSSVTHDAGYCRWVELTHPHLLPRSFVHLARAAGYRRHRWAELTSPLWPPRSCVVFVEVGR